MSLAATPHSETFYGERHWRVVPRRNPEPSRMKRLLNLVGMSAGGWVGWILGAQISVFTAFIVSMVGTGVGLYYTQRAVKRLLP